MNFPNFSDESTSLAKKHLTKSIFNALKGKETPNGFSLPMALASGIQNHDSGIGIYAGDAESYAVFSALFSPIIEEYHGITPGTIHGPDRSVVHLPDPDPQHQYILSTRIRVARNLAGYPFTPFIREKQRKKVTQKIIKTLECLPETLTGVYISMDPGQGQEEPPPMAMPSNVPLVSKRHSSPGSTPNICQCDEPKTQHTRNTKKTDKLKIALDKKQLQALPLKSFLFKKGDRFQEAAGINRDWPSSRGYFISHDTLFRVWIHEEDHLRIISMDDHGDMATTFNRLAFALESLEDKLKFAWDDTLGYLAACPSNIGTGMRAGVHIRLPRLFNQQELLHEEARRLNLQVRGTQGEKTQVEKAVFDISNGQRLGITEKKCLQTLHRGVIRLIALEQDLESE
ncbi:MAG: phosphagen kinase [Desulfobacterium sp.]